MPPLTATQRVTLSVTEMAVIEPTAEGLVLRERAPGASVEAILAAMSARLIVNDEIVTMPIG